VGSRNPARSRKEGLVATAGRKLPRQGICRDGADVATSVVVPASSQTRIVGATAAVVVAVVVAGIVVGVVVAGVLVGVVVAGILVGVTVAGVLVRVVVDGAGAGPRRA